MDVEDCLCRELQLCLYHVLWKLDLASQSHINPEKIKNYNTKFAFMTSRQIPVVLEMGGKGYQTVPVGVIQAIWFNLCLY